MRDPISEIGDLQAQQANRYSFVARPATGGQGEIYLARLVGSGGFEKLVAIKRVLSQRGGDSRYRERLRQEAHLVARLDHPNVCHVIDFVDGKSECFVVFEYLEGITYADVIASLPEHRSPEQVRLIVSVLQQVTEGLQAAHDLTTLDGRPAGLVHRDVSSRNVLITGSGMVKILDFGVAQTVGAESTSIAGTAPYMSPEQVAKKPLDRRSDVFALGTLAYEGLSGRSPFRRQERRATLEAIVRDPAPAFCRYQPSVSEELEEKVLLALEKNRARRYSDAREFGEALGAAIEPLGGSLTLSEMGKAIRQMFGQPLEERAAKVRSLISQTSSQGSPTLESLDSTETVSATFTDFERSFDGQTAATLPAVSTVVFADGLVPRDAPASRDAPALEDSTMAPPPKRRRWAWVLVLSVASLAALGVAMLPRLSHRQAGGEEPGVGPPLKTGTTAASQVAQSDPGPSDPPPGHPPIDAGVLAPPAKPQAVHSDAGRKRRKAGKKKRSGDDQARVRAKSRSRKANSKGKGFVTLDVTPHFAKVYIDGELVGTTPLFKHPVPAGRHTIRLVDPDGKVKVLSMDVVGGKEMPRRLIRWD